MSVHDEVVLEIDEIRVRLAADATRVFRTATAFSRQRQAEAVDAQDIVHALARIPKGRAGSIGQALAAAAERIGLNANAPVLRRTRLANTWPPQLSGSSQELVVRARAIAVNDTPSNRRERSVLMALPAPYAKSHSLIIESLGYEVRYDSVDRILEAADSNPPSVFILDRGIDNRRWLEAIATIRASLQHASVPIVVLSPKRGDAAETEALSVGASVCIDASSDAPSLRELLASYARAYDREGDSARKSRPEPFVNASHLLRALAIQSPSSGYPQSKAAEEVIWRRESHQPARQAPTLLTESIVSEFDASSRDEFRRAYSRLPVGSCLGIGDLLVIAFRAGGLRSRRIFSRLQIHDEATFVARLDRVGAEPRSVEFHRPGDNVRAWRPVFSSDAVQAMLVAHCRYQARNRHAAGAREAVARVLIVDDHEDNIEVLRSRLAIWGFECQEATNGQEALDRTREWRPDIILLDIMMPEMSGIEVARRIRASRDLRDVQIIMQTALDSTEDKVEGLEAGADDYVTKPIDFAELKARMRARLAARDRSAPVVLPGITAVDLLIGIFSVRHAPVVEGLLKSQIDVPGALSAIESQRIVTRARPDDEATRVCRSCHRELTSGEAAVEDEGGLTCAECVKLAVRALEESGNHTFVHTIRLPLGLTQAGSALLSYFATYLKARRPNSRSKVTIEQEGEELRLIVESEDGEPVEVVRHTFEEFVEVVTYRRPVEDVLSEQRDRDDLRSLMNLNAAAIARVSSLVQKHGQDVEELRTLMFRELEGQGAASPKYRLLQPSALHHLRSLLDDVSQLKPVDRGFAFEKFLGALFEASGLAPRASFRLEGEQIDGSIVLGEQTYLVEAKWTKAPAAQMPLLTLMGKVAGKAQWARGLFISYAGFSEEGLRAFGMGKPTNLICMDASDLLFVVSGRATLGDVIEKKARQAAECNIAFAPAESLFSE